jgi:hypothetical protein
MKDLWNISPFFFLPQTETRQSYTTKSFLTTTPSHATASHDIITLHSSCGSNLAYIASVTPPRSLHTNSLSPIACPQHHRAGTIRAT